MRVRARVGVATRMRLAGALAGALLVAGSAIAYAAATAPRVVSTTPAETTRTDRPTVVVYLRHVTGLQADDVRATVNGVDVSERASVHTSGDRGEIELRLPALSEGRHKVHVRTAPFGALRRRVDVRWSFSVDTTSPRLQVTRPTGQRATSDVRNTTFGMRTEAGAELTVDAGGHRASTRAGDDGRARLTMRAREGRQRVRISAVDAAGNRTTRALVLFVDSIAPVVRFNVPRVSRSGEVRIAANASDANDFTLAATVDGTATGTRIVQQGRMSWDVVRAEPLAEGTHTLTFAATDEFGHTSTVERRTLVNSTEELGEVTVGSGARGRDVRQLQRRLRELGFWRGGGSARREWQQRVYGAATAAAVTRFQEERGLAADGIAGTDTIAAMTLRIVINRGTHTLTLFRLNKVVHTYMVAVGQSAYPTPSGDFVISNMAMNPTWTPPDSPWAAGAKPIPPGPNNPLGTRWMGLNTPNVGIHGTNNPASVGYSVSHGCIRMQIPDVEDLYGRVREGTPVTII